MYEEDIEILKASKDGLQVKQSAIRLIKSRDRQHAALLQGHLLKEEFLLRLDSAEAYEGSHRSLRLLKVMRALADSRQPPFENVIVKLAESPLHAEHPLRLSILICCTANLRPPAPAVVNLWKINAAAESDYATDVSECLVINQSEAALQIYSGMLADPGHPQSLRISWLRRHLLPRRDDLPLLQMSNHCLREKLDPAMQRFLLQVIYDFQPKSWYKSCGHPQPPPRHMASKEAKLLLCDMARYALSSVQLPPAERRPVADTLARLEDQRNR